MDALRRDIDAALDRHDARGLKSEMDVALAAFLRRALPAFDVAMSQEAWIDEARKFKSDLEREITGGPDAT